MPPGARLEKHDEPMNEMFYMIKGAMGTEGKQYGEGTHHFTPAGMSHAPFDTRDRCLVLVTKFSR